MHVGLCTLPAFADRAEDLEIAQTASRSEADAVLDLSKSTNQDMVLGDRIGDFGNHGFVILVFRLVKTPPMTSSGVPELYIVLVLTILDTSSPISLR